MINTKIKPKQLTQSDTGDFIGIATSVNQSISYELGSPKAKAYHEYLDEQGNSLLKGNIDIPTDNWGEDDSLMFSRHLEMIKCQRL